MSSQLSSGSGSTLEENQYCNSFAVTGLSPSIGYSSMQASQKQGSSGASPCLYYQPIQDSDFYCFPRNYQSLNDHYVCSNIHESGQLGAHFPSFEPYCPLDSSSGTGSGYRVYASPSTLSFSPNGSSTVQESHSYPPDHHNMHGNMLMMRGPESDDQMLWSGPDADDDIDMDKMMGMFNNGDDDQQDEPSEPVNWKRVMEVLSRKDLKETLIACAEFISDKELLMADLLIAELRNMVSVSGDPIQRLGAYILEGLVARLDSSGSCIYKSLKCNIPLGSKLLSYMQILYEACPYYKFGYISANGAIAKAVEHENRIHIIDFQIAQGSQWIPLIKDLATRPGGPPQYIRITGVDDDQSTYARGGSLHIVGQRLMRHAESFKVPFEFHAAAINGCQVELGNLGIRPKEAIAVNFPFVLHHMPDESVSVENHRDRLLRLVRSLGPKVVTLVEQESNTNTSAFLPRFVETLSFYTAMFESVDVKLPRESKERINVEQNCIARDVVSIIACEGAERVERHELLGKWKARLTMAGFTPWPLNSAIKAPVKTLLEEYSDKYTLEERDGALYLGWMNKRLFTSSAWRCR